MKFRNWMMLALVMFLCLGAGFGCATPQADEVESAPMDVMEEPTEGEPEAEEAAPEATSEEAAPEEAEASEDAEEAEAEAEADTQE